MKSDDDDLLEDWCGTNDCERPSCHRCFPRQDCSAHEKCRESQSPGTVDDAAARVAAGLFAIKLKSWLMERGLLHDSRFYTQQDWRARGEPYGNDALITLCAEGSGSLNRVFNYDMPGDEDRQVFIDFNALVKRNGYWYERGYSWSWHFYLLEEPCAGCGRSIRSNRERCDRCSRPVCESCRDSATEHEDFVRCFPCAVQTRSEALEDPRAEMKRLHRMDPTQMTEEELRLLRCAILDDPRRKTDRLRCCFSDCPEQHPLCKEEDFGFEAYDEEPITCRTCRHETGLSLLCEVEGCWNETEKCPCGSGHCEEHPHHDHIAEDVETDPARTGPLAERVRAIAQELADMEMPERASILRGIADELEAISKAVKLLFLLGQ